MTLPVIRIVRSFWWCCHVMNGISVTELWQLERDITRAWMEFLADNQVYKDQVRHKEICGFSHDKILVKASEGQSHRLTIILTTVKILEF